MAKDIIIEAAIERALAEKTTDPAKYRYAASLLMQAGMQAAAQRMIDRAEHYEKLRDGLLL